MKPIVRTSTFVRSGSPFRRFRTITSRAVPTRPLTPTANWSFATTPLTRTQFLASFILSRLLFLAAEVAFLVGFGALVFDVEVQGSLPLLFGVALLGVLCFTGFAVLCAARTASVEVVSGFINALTLPMWLASGTFFSYERFPEAVQPIIQALPLTALNDSLRGVMLEGMGFVSLLPELGLLAAWGIVSFLIALKVFRWQ